VPPTTATEFPELTGEDFERRRAPRGLSARGLAGCFTEARATVLSQGEAEMTVASVAALVVDALTVDAGACDCLTLVHV